MTQQDFRQAVRRGLQRFRPSFCEPSRVDSFINDVEREYLSKVAPHQDATTGKQILRVIFASVATKAFDLHPVYDAGMNSHVADLLLEEMAAVAA